KGPAVIAVLRTGDTTSAVTVNFAASPGTAVDVDDFTAFTGPLSFAAGESGKIINVVITNDNVKENKETVTLQLSTPTGGSGATLGTPSTAVLTIKDDDHHHH